MQGISETRAYLLCNPELLVELLSEDRIVVSSEMVVFEAAIRWLDFDSQRLQYAAKVLNCVRFSLIAPEDIIQKLEKHPHLAFIPNYNSKLYHAMW